MTTRNPALVTAFVLLAPIAACGADDTTGPSDSTPPTTPDASEPATEMIDVRLTVEYTHAEAEIEFRYEIHCNGPDGEVTGDVEQAEVDPSEACTALGDAAVVERLVQGPQDDVCTEIYGGADVAQLSGTIDERTVDTSVDRTNGCGIDDWDELLSALLPPAIGVSPSY